MTRLAEQPFIVALFGAPGSGKRVAQNADLAICSGKTSLTKRLASKQDERRTVERAIVDIGPYAVSFEIADMSHLGKTSQAYLQGVHAVIVVYDTTNYVSTYL